MADDLSFPSSNNKHKFDHPSPNLPSRRPIGFSSPISSSSPDVAAPAMYNNISSLIELARQKAQQIIARVFNDSEHKHSRVRVAGMMTRVLILRRLQGRPKGVTPKYSFKPLVLRLSELIGYNIEITNDCIGEEAEKKVAALPGGGVLLLENVRFYKEEEKNDPEFAKKLASLADLYVNDAFGTAHRAHASTEGVAKYVKPVVAGLLMQKDRVGANSLLQMHGSTSEKSPPSKGQSSNTDMLQRKFANPKSTKMSSIDCTIE